MKWLGWAYGSSAPVYRVFQASGTFRWRRDARAGCCVRSRWTSSIWPSAAIPATPSVGWGVPVQWNSIRRFWNATSGDRKCRAGTRCPFRCWWNCCATRNVWPVAVVPPASGTAPFCPSSAAFQWPTSGSWNASLGCDASDPFRWKRPTRRNSPATLGCSSNPDAPPPIPPRFWPRFRPCGNLHPTLPSCCRRNWPHRPLPPAPLPANGGHARPMTGGAFQDSRDLPQQKGEDVQFVVVPKTAARWRRLTESAHSAVVRLQRVEIVHLLMAGRWLGRRRRRSRVTGARPAVPEASGSAADEIGSVAVRWLAPVGVQSVVGCTNFSRNVNKSISFFQTRISLGSAHFGTFCRLELLTRRPNFMLLTTVNTSFESPFDALQLFFWVKFD